MTYGLGTPFVMKLDPDFNLLYSSFLGGSTCSSTSKAIAADNSGNAYVTGYTGYGDAGAPDFPVKNAYMTAPAGDIAREDAWVAKFNTTLAGEDSLVWSTYLGGNHRDMGTGIAIDSVGNVYVSGLTKSTDFPTANAYISTLGTGCYWAFLSKFSTDGASILYSTYITDAYEFFDSAQVPDVKVAAQDGQAYLTGGSATWEFPIRNGYQQWADVSPGYPAWLIRFNTNASGDASLVYGTYIGSVGASSSGIDIAADRTGNAYITGTTVGGFPLRGYRAPEVSGGKDTFLAMIDTNRIGDASLVWSTYLGGTDNENVTGLALGTHLALVGYTRSADLPVTPDAFQPSHANVENDDAFVIKWSNPIDIAMPTPATPSIFYIPRLQYSILRPFPSSSVPLSAMSAYGGHLKFQATLPRFSTPVNVYLGISWGDKPSYGTEQVSALGPNLHFVDAYGKIQPATQGKPIWQARISKVVDRLVSLDIAGLTVDSENLNVFIMVEPATLQTYARTVPYHAWMARIPLAKEQCEKVVASLESLMNTQGKNPYISNAVAYLKSSLDPKYWSNSWTPEYLQVFIYHQQAVSELMKSGVVSQTVTQAVSSIREADYTMATDAVVNAVEMKANPQNILKARNLMAQVQKALTAKNFSQAINLYGQAWTQADGALQVVSLSNIAK